MGDRPAGQILADQRCGSFGLLAPDGRQPRVGGLSLGQPQDVPLRLAVADEVDRVGHGIDSPRTFRIIRGTGRGVLGGRRRLARRCPSRRASDVVEV